MKETAQHLAYDNCQGPNVALSYSDYLQRFGWDDIILRAYIKALKPYAYYGIKSGKLAMFAEIVNNYDNYAYIRAKAKFLQQCCDRNVYFIDHSPLWTPEPKIEIGDMAEVAQHINPGIYRVCSIEECSPHRTNFMGCRISLDPLTEEYLLAIGT